LVVILLLAIAVGMLVLVVRLRLLALKIVAGGLSLIVSMSMGLVLVNDYYGYYRTWGDAIRDLAGSTATVAFSGRADRNHGYIQSGTLQQIALAGKVSGINRDGLVYLPPQYFDAQYRKVKFPVLEMFHGSPGKPTDWLSSLHVTRTFDELIASHQIGPMVLVMPSSNQGNSYQECLNAPRGAVDTYLTTDVPADIRATYRVSADPAQWGLAGYSSGGYCAANLALRHRSLFGAAVSLDGYYRPDDGPAGAVLRDAPQLKPENDPYAAALALNDSTRPVPSLWLMSGAGGADEKQAKAFVDAMRHVEQVPLVLASGAGHDFYAWAAAMPGAFKWSWQTLAPPDLRVMFPIAGPSTVQTLPLPRRPHSPRPAKSPSLPIIVNPSRVHSSPPSRSQSVTPTQTGSVTPSSTPR
jgi:enterochelin esterase-like enzyme